jgi:hypothetical protein
LGVYFVSTFFKVSTKHDGWFNSLREKELEADAETEFTTASGGKRVTVVWTVMEGPSRGRAVNFCGTATMADDAAEDDA